MCNDVGASCVVLYDVLFDYRVYLEGRYSPATATTYFRRMCFLLEQQFLIDSFKDVDMAKVLNQLSKVKHKNYFSQCKNALKHFCEFEKIKLDSDYLEQVNQLQNSTRKKYRKLKIINYKEVVSKINHLKNLKLRLSYLTMLNTGLRVSELAQLMSCNCSISNGKVVFYFIGKGGKQEKVQFLKSDDTKYFKEIQELVQQTKPNEFIFYSANYLQTHAQKLDFGCHDLRRMFAQVEYKKSKSRQDVMKKLRHSNLKTTNIYLKSKIKF